MDHEGPGGLSVTLSQSTAILLYCADKSGKFMPKDAAARPAVLQALMSASTDVTPIFGALTAMANAKPPHEPSVQAFKDRLRGFFKVWDEQLAKRKFAGATRSHADLSAVRGYWSNKGRAARAGGEIFRRPMGRAMAARPAISARSSLGSTRLHGPRGASMPKCYASMARAGLGDVLSGIAKILHVGRQVPARQEGSAPALRPRGQGGTTRARDRHERIASTDLVRLWDRSHRAQPSRGAGRGAHGQDAAIR